MNHIHCHLFKRHTLTSTDLNIQNVFDLVEVFEDESHDKKYLIACKQCQQLYYFAFHEEVDFAGGNDAQFSRFIPVETPEAARNFSTMQFESLNACAPAIHKDFPSDADEPKVFWVN